MNEPTLHNKETIFLVTVKWFEACDLSGANYYLLGEKYFVYHPIKSIVGLYDSSKNLFCILSVHYFMITHNIDFFARFPLSYAEKCLCCEKIRRFTQCTRTNCLLIAVSHLGRIICEGLSTKFLTSNYNSSWSRLCLFYEMDNAYILSHHGLDSKQYLVPLTKTLPIEYQINSLLQFWSNSSPSDKWKSQKIL